MVERTIIDPMEQMRDFDFVMFEHDVLTAIGGLVADATSGLATTVVGGLVASQTNVPSLSINIASGRIYQFAPADLVAVGSIPQDLNTIVQQGFAAAQTLALIAPSSGQSQWNLVQCQFSQVDAVRTNDPNGGIVPFYNAANPSQPTLNSVNTVRQAKCVLQVISGAAATTGSETPPTPTAGWAPLYLIDLAGGQTQITTSQIRVAGPNIGTGVSGSYPNAPFLAGFLASHHSGTAGQAPKIKLGSEVQGVLPYINMSPVRTLLTGNLTLNVNTNTGSDANNGLSAATPFATIQAAVAAMYRFYDWNGFSGTISVANGAYTAPVAAYGLPPGMNTPINIVGNVASPGSVTVVTVNNNCFYAQSGAQLNVSGFLMQATGTAGSTQGYCLYAWMGGIINFGSCVFGSSSNGHLFGQQGGAIFISTALGAAYTIVGGVVNAGGGHITVDAAGVVALNGATCTLSGTPSFTSFVVGNRGGVVQVALSTTYTGAATGARYTLTTNAGVSTTGTAGVPNQTFFPGNSVGSALTGAYYL